METIDGGSGSIETGSNAARLDDETESDQKQPILQWKTKKRVKRQQREDSTSIVNVLQSESIIHDKNGDDRLHDVDREQRTGPLIIPVAPDRNKWQPTGTATTPTTTKNPSTVPHPDDAPLSHMDNDSAAAIQALHDDTISHHINHHNHNGTTSITSIPGRANTFVSDGGATVTKPTQKSFDDCRDVQQYHKDMEALPVALEETAEAYQRVPITEFGAALLRGMGWTDHDHNNNTENKKKQQLDDTILPRPHRLGLGAIPAAAAAMVTDQNVVGGRRPRNVDQYQRDQRTQKQQDMYRLEREKKLAEDRQRTIQNGSIVHLVLPDTIRTDERPSHRRQRARILKWVGVPGLNMVQVQMEHSGSSIIIKRNDIDGLVTRDELDQFPFQEMTIEAERDPLPTTDETPIDHNGIVKERKRDRKDSKRCRHDKYDHEDMNVSWVIPNIRVRIVTEKLGRRYYKEKGIVVDVTRHAGVTLKLNNSSSSHSATSAAVVVLDRIPERYLETALPKVGGNVIVVNQQHSNHYAKGKYIERDAKNKNYGIVQLHEDMNCIRLPLDDMAEWCGPLDDDEF